MNNDENLSDLSDDELNALFAVEVAGYTISNGWKEGRGGKDLPQQWWTAPTGLSNPCPPCFATNANDVLPWLEKYEGVWKATNALEAGVGISLTVFHPPSKVHAIAATFCRAAVVALLRAKRAEKAE